MNFRREKNFYRANSISAILVCLGTIFGMSSASADDDSGLYAGVAANRLSADFEDQNDVNFDDSDTTPSARIGYMFNNTLGVELGYLDLGGYRAEGDTPGNLIEIDGDAVSLALVANFTVTDTLDLYLKGGGYNVQADANSSIAGVTLVENEDENVAFGAVGLELDLGSLNIFGEISEVATDINDLSIDIATVGVKFEFGRLD